MFLLWPNIAWGKKKTDDAKITKTPWNGSLICNNPSAKAAADEIVEDVETNWICECIIILLNLQIKVYFLLRFTILFKAHIHNHRIYSQFLDGYTFASSIKFPRCCDRKIFYSHHGYKIKIFRRYTKYRWRKLIDNQEWLSQKDLVHIRIQFVQDKINSLGTNQLT